MKDRRVAGTGTPDHEWRSWTALNTVPSVTAAMLVPPGKRLVLLAPHPDDEILMAAGLLQQVFAQGTSILLVAATDGEGSHPGSQEWPQERLVAVRPTETVAALGHLEIGDVTIERLGFPDGGLIAQVDVLQERLTTLLTPDDVVITTWMSDGHPDHEICGKVAATVAANLDISMVEVPVWTWHWSMPDDPRVPWGRARRLMLDPDQVQRKIASISAFKSQLGPDLGTGREAVVPASMVERLSRPYEIFFL